MTKVFRIKSSLITDWDSFHAVFKEALNLPDYYGKNMDAWIDLIDEMTDEPLILDMGDCSQMPLEIFSAILECAAFVNYRRLEMNESANLIISAHKPML